jgi:hypothetical protein
MRERVEVRLEVVELGEHELVVGVAPRLFQVQPHEVERGPRVRQSPVLVRQHEPGLGELPLGVPPHRVVVEVRDHPHRPAGLGYGDGRGELGPPAAGGSGDGLGDRGDRKLGTGRPAHRDAHLAGTAFPGFPEAYPERLRRPRPSSHDPQVRGDALLSRLGGLDGNPYYLQGQP